MASMSNVKVGTYTGAGAAITLELGFLPEFFISFNVTDKTIAGIWFNSAALGAGTAIDLALALASNADNGFTLLQGATGATAKGMTIGTDYATNAKVYCYLAIGQ